MHLEASAADLPIDFIAAVYRIERRACASNRDATRKIFGTRRTRLNTRTSIRVARRREIRVQIESGERAVQPLADRTERALIERARLEIARARIRAAVPTLPDRRCALCNRIPPTRRGRLQQQLISEVEPAVVRQYVK